MKAGTFPQPALAVASLFPSWEAVGGPLLPKSSPTSSPLSQRWLRFCAGTTDPAAAAHRGALRVGVRTTAVTASQSQSVPSPRRRQRCQLNQFRRKPRSPSVFPKARECWAQEQPARLGRQRRRGESSVLLLTERRLKTRETARLSGTGGGSSALIQKKKPNVLSQSVKLFLPPPLHKKKALGNVILIRVIRFMK